MADGQAATAATPGAASATPMQAVVLVHGIGEQVPLETLRGFVETVYQRDTTLAGAGEARFETIRERSGTHKLNQVWIVPDEATGSAELRRISTPWNANNVRTDFFEFYWADIMEGTPVELAVDWIWGLLLRSPLAMPPCTKIWLAWLLLWVVSLVTLALGLFATMSKLDAFKPAEAVLQAWITEWHGVVGWIFVVIGIVVLAWRLLSAPPSPRTKVTAPALLVVIGLALLFVPLAVLTEITVWAAILTAISAAIFSRLVGPYVGDVARYVRATPATVDRRKAIRDRGLEVLKSIHAKAGPDGAPYYDRVVLVGHSLGCIIAYDLLLHYWETAGPNHKRAFGPDQDPQPWVPEPDVAKALDELDKQSVQTVWKVRGQPPVTQNFSIDTYRGQQAAVFKALARSKIGWRISDFVTLGSPLAHADFLMVDDDKALRRAFAERLFSSAPPRPDWPNPSMLYGIGGQPERGLFPHFAAPFAAVRWTNLFDESWLPVLGHVISGALAEEFGPGIQQIPVRMKHALSLPGLRRIFTHTLYWAWQPHFADELPEHLQQLRLALDLGGTAALHTRTGDGDPTAGPPPSNAFARGTPSRRRRPASAAKPK